MTRGGAELVVSLDRVIEWVKRHEYRAWEPADGNASVLFPLTFGRVPPMRVLQQVVLRSPINIRPLLGVRRHESAIGRGYMAWGYLLIYRRTSQEDVRNEATTCLEWLINNRATDQREHCWGDPYEYATRGGRRPLGAPILIWTALIGQVFLEAFEVCGDNRYLRVAESAGRWIKSLPIEQTSSGTCLSYNGYRQSSIHNSNAMGAAFLARLAAINGDAEAMSLARIAMTYTCARQHADGSWFYGEEPKYHWIDNFHTGYNLSALHTYQVASGDRDFAECLAIGLRYFKRHFFEADGRPKYFHDRTYPVDIQCAAQAIDTLVTTAGNDPEAMTLALRVAQWTIANMQARDGHFRYRHLGRWQVNTPMLHWGQGTMTKALATALLRLDSARHAAAAGAAVAALSH